MLAEIQKLADWVNQNAAQASAGLVATSLSIPESRDAKIDYPPGDATLLPLKQRVYAWLFSRHFLESPLTATYLVWAAVWVAMIWGLAAASFLRKDL